MHEAIEELRREGARRIAGTATLFGGIVPVDGFFEWKAIKGQKAKQPYAIAMKDGSPFGLGGLWENWKNRTSGEWVRTFAIVTTDANRMVAEIHDRMPLILAPSDYARWPSNEPDPGDLLRPFLAEPMRMWPISTRVNKPENDDPSVLEPIERSAAQRIRSGVAKSGRRASTRVMKRGDWAKDCPGYGLFLKMMF